MGNLFIRIIGLNVYVQLIDFLATMSFYVIVCTQLLVKSMMLIG
jgi:hypothetical protein